MFCFNCGSQIPDNSVFCPECGAKVAAGAAQKKVSAEKPAEIVKDKFPVSNPTPKPQENSLQKGKGKKKKIIAIVAALVLLIAAGGVFAFFHSSDSSFDSNTTDSNAVSNTNSNLMNGGFVTTKNDTVYYVKFVDSFYKTELKSMDINGGNVKTLYSFDGEIELLNIVGNQIYFDGDTYDEKYAVVKSNIFVLNLNDLSVNTVFDPQDIDVTPGSAESVCGDDAQYIYSMFINENKIYFELYKSGVNGIYSMNLDGSDLTTIIQKNSGTMDDFSMADSLLFYQYNYDAFYRCDLEGDNTTKLYDEASNYAGFCINDGKIYLYDRNDNYYSDDNYVSKIISMDLDGGDSEEIAQFEEFIYSINVVGDKIYYALLSHNPNFKQICSMNLDGSDQKVLKTSDIGGCEGYYSGINVCGHWLYYLVTDNDGHISSGKLDLNDVTE